MGLIPKRRSWSASSGIRWRGRDRSKVIAPFGRSQRSYHRDCRIFGQMWQTQDRRDRHSHRGEGLRKMKKYLSLSGFWSRSSLAAAIACALTLPAVAAQLSGDARSAIPKDIQQL